ncbi:hypothetical protein JOF48_003877 [Arthrobacter stackebrandtii]|uniref:SRPBCC domain-containing protein n=1 Tax=Arthrobacter stackebrandtii TaxID=272161 RepID=A0ABS4Z4A9_9MICC|nr:hypothetical protein [Arthrobacter stackebrandtii]MBP2415078.1 hypothetical protein [Arthrobacter stackebrandtii]PYH00782.1 hypothetical protein CVV67_07375 [Arthrobacter stackebrandtii]
MQNLFSHAHEPDYVAPLESEQRELDVLLDVPLDQAFDGFTDAIHLWWPVDDQSVFGEGSHVALLRDHLVEESLDGDEVVWADIADWQAPAHLGLRWILDGGAGEGPEVEVSFSTVDGGLTRVSVGYEQVEDAESVGEGSFACDWPLILSRYARFMGGAVSLD